MRIDDLIGRTLAGGAIDNHAHGRFQQSAGGLSFGEDGNGRLLSSCWSERSRNRSRPFIGPLNLQNSLSLFSISFTKNEN